MNCPNTEQIVGIDRYSTQSKGIGGETQKYFEDFVVDELISINGDSHRVSTFNQCHNEIGLFTHFVIRKKGLDTPETAYMIAQRLGILLDAVGYAGNKDKRAITTQRMSAWKVEPRLIWNRLSPLAKLQVLSAYTSRYSVKLGDLWGNHFKIRIRGIKLPVVNIISRLDRIINEIKLFGVPNFFGTQRFGQRSISHLVGKYLLMGQIKPAVMIYLTHTSPYESVYIRNIRQQILEEQNFKKSMNKFPAGFQYEKQILKILSRRHNDFKGALSAFPRRILSLFIHAYQSWIFNKYLSERIKCLDSWQNPLPGDLIQIVNSNKPDYVTEHNIAHIQELASQRKAFVVGPLLGYKSPIPRGKSGEIFNKILRTEIIHPNIFNQQNRLFASTGRLRRLFIFPHGFKTHIFKISLNECVLNLTFSLEKGEYATIVLREFMKDETLNKILS